jgi:hypothetical protein
MDSVCKGRYVDSEGELVFSKKRRGIHREKETSIDESFQKGNVDANSLRLSCPVFQHKALYIMTFKHKA